MPKKNTRNLTQAEAMEIFHQDGILEVVFGATLLNFGFDILNELSFTSLFTFVPIVLMSAMKNQVTIARIGYDAFEGDDTQVRNWNLFTAIGMVVTLVALSFFVLNDALNVREAISLPFGSYLPALFSGIILAIASLAAAILIPLKRFFLYSAAALVLGVVSLFFFPAQVTAFAFAGVLLGNGIRLMVKFARKYPLDKGQGKNKEEKK